MAGPEGGGLGEDARGRLPSVNAQVSPVVQRVAEAFAVAMERYGVAEGVRRLVHVEALGSLEEHILWTEVPEGHRTLRIDRLS